MNKTIVGIVIAAVAIAGIMFYQNDKDVGISSVRQTMPEVNLLVATTTPGTSNRYDVSSYRHVDFFVTTASSFYGTLKVKGSAQADVNFKAAQSATNRWEYVQSKLLDTGATVNGDTGIAFTGTDDHRLYEVNTNYLKNIAFETSTTSAGSIAVWLSGAND